MSNKTYAWLIGGCLAAIALLAVLISIAQQLQAASLWIALSLAALALIAVLTGLYMLWHQVHKRHLARKRDATEIKLLREQYDDEKWRLDSEALHRHELERNQQEQAYQLQLEKIRVEQMRLQLERERLHLIEATRVVIPEGHTVVFPADNYQSINSPRHATQLAQNAGPQQTEQEIASAPAFAAMQHLITSERLVLCYTSNGPAYGTVDDLLSMAITGKPGRGKTTALMYYVGMLLRNGAEVVIWDPHGAMNEISVLNGRRLPHMPATARVRYLDRKADIVASVPQLHAELAERDELYRNGKQTKHPLLILADELPVLADYDEQVAQEYKQINKQHAKDGEELEPVPSMITVIRRFVLEARKWRCFFIGSGQTMDAEILPTRVTQSLNSRIVFFSSDMRARMAGLENDAIKNLLPQIRRAGPGVMVFDCSRWDSPVIGAIPAISTDDMLTYLGITTVADRPTITLSERHTGPLAGTGTLRDMRPSHEQDRLRFFARKQELSEPDTDPFASSVESSAYAQENGVESPQNEAQGTQRPAKYRLSDVQIAQYRAIFPYVGDRDERLRQVGANTSYREHAKEIEQQYGLKRGN